MVPTASVAHETVEDEAEYEDESEEELQIVRSYCLVKFMYS